MAMTKVRARAVGMAVTMAMATAMAMAMAVAMAMAMAVAMAVAMAMAMALAMGFVKVGNVFLVDLVLPALNYPIQYFLFLIHISCWHRITSTISVHIDTYTYIYVISSIVPRQQGKTK